MFLNYLVEITNVRVYLVFDMSLEQSSGVLSEVPQQLRIAGIQSITNGDRGVVFEDSLSQSSFLIELYIDWK